MTPSLPSFVDVQKNYASSDFLLLDRDGKALHQVRADKNYRALEWVPLESISPALVHAVLMSEDRRFMEHRGVDFKSLGGAIYDALFRSQFRGASTLTMQTVKLISSNRNAWTGIFGKLLQFNAALSLERTWSKNQILEAYLNKVPWRGEIVGVSAASKSLFRKEPKGLNLGESTLMAVLIRSPNAHQKMVVKRACAQEPVNCNEVSILAQETFSKTRNPTVEVRDAYHLSRRLANSVKQGHVQTTISQPLQKFVQERLQSQVMSLKSQNVHDGAVLVIENQTGEVWSYVGGSGPASSAPYVDGVTSLRQAGSTLKPFLYATAFEEHLLTPDSWLDDSAVDIVFDRGVYKPQNHDKTFYGWVQAKTALASSLNVPAVKVFKLLGNDSFWQKLNKMAFPALKDADHYGPALALGVADVSLESLTTAYRMLAEKGYYSTPVFLKDQKMPTPVKIFDSEAAAKVGAILSQKELRSLGFGLESVLSQTRGAAVKTGTSKDMRDNWCVGFNSRFTVGVWIGNFDGSPMWNVMGVTGAAPLWAEVMQWLDKHYPGEAPLSLPLAESEQNEPVVVQRSKILYPQDGMILAVDPEIPMVNQKVPFLAEIMQGKKAQWRVNNGKIIDGESSYLWTPSRGRHQIELLQNGVATQKIEILVK